jgi:hypothetical protein
MPTPRLIKIDGDVAYIPLTSGYVSIIDSSDVPLVSSWSWHAAFTRNSVRAVRSFRRDGVGYTRNVTSEVLGLDNGVVVDHRDGDPLNNRRSNLRISGYISNAHNSKIHSRNKCGFKGVSTVPGQENRWRSVIYVRGSYIRLGCFSDPELAARAYDDAARHHFGEFAALNFALPGERCARSGIVIPPENLQLV